jgi:pimeloyl-ACP methyl ester carboxylesterase
MFRWDATRAMSRITAPLLVLSGELDIVTKPDAGDSIAVQHPSGKNRRIEGVNHMGFLERADIYNPAIAAFAAAAHGRAVVEAPELE